MADGRIQVVECTRPMATGTLQMSSISKPSTASTIQQLIQYILYTPSYKDVYQDAYPSAEYTQQYKAFFFFREYVDPSCYIIVCGRMYSEEWKYETHNWLCIRNILRAAFYLLCVRLSITMDEILRIPVHLHTLQVDLTAHNGANGLLSKLKSFSFTAFLKMEPFFIERSSLLIRSTWYKMVIELTVYVNTKWRTI